MAATYLTPGVYVEEVPSGSATLSAGATAVAAFVGFTAKAPKDDPDRSRRAEAPSRHELAQFEELYGGFVPGSDAAPLGVRLLQQRRVDGLHRAHPAHRAVEGAGHSSRCRRATAPSGRRSSSRRSSRTPTSSVIDHARAAGRRRRRRRTADVPRRRRRRAARRSRASRASRSAGRPTSTRSTRTSTKVKVATKIDVDQLAADLRTIPTGTHSHRAGAGQLRSPCPVGRSPDPRPPAPASTASSSPRTSRW